MEHDQEDIKLFDLLGSDHPYNEEFRINRVYRCYVCLAETNRAIHMTGRFGGGAHAVCPGEQERWHKTLEEMVRWLKLHPHPASYKKEMEDEIRLMRYQHVSKNDVVGNPELTNSETLWIHKPIKLGFLS